MLSAWVGLPASVYAFPGGFDGSWQADVEPAVMRALGDHEQATYNGSLSSLLRAVRNMREHRRAWRRSHAEALALVGETGRELLEWVEGRWPELWVAVWQWARGRQECRGEAALREWVEA